MAEAHLLYFFLIENLAETVFLSKVLASLNRSQRVYRAGSEPWVGNVITQLLWPLKVHGKRQFLVRLFFNIWVRDHRYLLSESGIIFLGLYLLLYPLRKQCQNKRPFCYLVNTRQKKKKIAMFIEHFRCFRHQHLSSKSVRKVYIHQENMEMW